MRTVRLGYSPCPNDTFLFYPLVHGLVDTEGYAFEPVLEDVETLNRLALAGALEMTKVSYAAVGHLWRTYWCLRSGGALGRGCGPVVVARDNVRVTDVADERIAAPGRYTTARLLLELRLGRPVYPRFMPFHEIMPAVRDGVADLGVVIHEGRFTYRGYGLREVEDLGAWWEGATGLPLPLGAILVRRDVEGLDPVRLERALRRSVEYALAHPTEPMGYVLEHAQELAPGVVEEHIGLYVNAFSSDLGEEGRRAVEALLTRATRAGVFERTSGQLFPPEERC